MISKCHKQDEFIARIQKNLGVNLQGTSCHIVNEDGMANVMAKAGWSRNQTTGVVGFQLGNNVYVLDSAPWTVLHELVHRSGVNSDRLSRFVAEGLTEAIAMELKQSADEHKPTYPMETEWVRTKLLPRLNMTAIELGRVIAKSTNPPRDLAALMVKADPSKQMAVLERELQPQKSEQPSFNRAGHVTRLGVQSSDHTEGLAMVLITAGIALGLPAMLRRYNTR